MITIPALKNLIGSAYLPARTAEQQNLPSMAPERDLIDPALPIQSSRPSALPSSDSPKDSLT